MSNEIEYPHYMDVMPDELKEMWKPLKDKQKKFIVLYCRYGSAKRAAIDSGYSRNCAAEIGYENLIKPHIKPIIDWMSKYIIDNALDTSICTVAERIKILSEMARSDISDFTLTGDIIDLTAEGANSANVKELTTTTDEQGSLITKIKMYSSVDAIKELNKMDGSHSADKVRHVDKNDNDVEPQRPLIIATKNMTKEELDDIGFVKS